MAAAKRKSGKAKTKAKAKAKAGASTGGRKPGRKSKSGQSPRKNRQVTKTSTREPSLHLTASDRAKFKAMTIAMRQRGDSWIDICRTLDVTYTAIRGWRGADLDFDTALLDCDQLNQENLERELYRRALDGVVEDVFDRQGNKIGEKYRKSDVLLLAALKKLDPEWKRALSTTIHAADIDDPPKLTISLFDSGNAGGEVASGQANPQGLLAERAAVEDADYEEVEVRYSGHAEAEGSDDD